MTNKKPLRADDPGEASYISQYTDPRSGKTKNQNPASADDGELFALTE